MDAQVIIVGAGPAGAWLAYHLAKENVSTMILEKETIPRYKACGGALSQKASLLLSTEFDHEDIPIESEIDRLTFRCPGEPDVEYHRPGKGMALVMRDRFDAFLVRCAQRTGAILVDSSTVGDVEISTDQVVVHTAEGQYRAEMIVGADGATGPVARFLGIKPATIGTTIQGEVKGEFPGELTDRLILDYGHIPHGYSWVFPKKSHLSIGTGSMNRAKIPLREMFFDYLEYLGIDAESSEILLRGHPIPSGIRRILAGERFLLVGDAGHLADPLTGEGIYSALRSGELAAEEIIGSLKRGRTDLHGYAVAVRKELGPETLVASLLARLIFRWPRHVHRMLGADPLLMDNVISVIQGEAKYQQAYTQIREGLMQRMKGHHLTRADQAASTKEELT